jgi:uroporphyrinogen-III synthase
VAVLVTRPAPDNEATAAVLRARGLEPLLAPLLLFQPIPFRGESDTRFSGVILTSANAIRAIAAHELLARLRPLPVFAVGERTGQAAREAGFGDVRVADGDASALRELIAATATKSKARTLLYLSAADVSRDLGGELGLRGVTVTSLPVYRMAALHDLPAPVLDAFAGNAIEAVLHYSRRSALAFVEAARRSGIEISALALPQVCLSEPIAAALRDAGASRPSVARAPNETELLAALEQALRPTR